MSNHEDFINLISSTISEIVPNSDYQLMITSNINVTRCTSWFKTLPSLRRFKHGNVFNVLPTAEIVNPQPCLSYNNFLRDYNYECDKIYAIFTVDNRDILVGALKIDGNIVIYKNPLFEIFEKSKDQCKEILVKICKFTKKSKAAYFSGNDPEFCKNDILTTMLLNIYSSMTYIKEPKPEAMLKKIVVEISNTLKNVCNDGSIKTFGWLINSNSLYRNLVNDMLEARETENSVILERGILIGSKFFAGLQRAGYIYDILSGKWTKEVNMVPEFCMRDNIIYKIPEKYRNWKVVDFIYDPLSMSGEDFVLHSSTSNHPNISSGFKICIGQELRNKYRDIIREALIIQEYVQFLIDIEKALEIINFDSAYHPLSYYHDVSYSSFERVTITDRPTNTKGLRRL